MNNLRGGIMGFLYWRKSASSLALLPGEDTLAEERRLQAERRTSYKVAWQLSFAVSVLGAISFIGSIAIVRQQNQRIVQLESNVRGLSDAFKLQLRVNNSLVKEMAAFATKNVSLVKDLGVFTPDFLKEKSKGVLEAVASTRKGTSRSGSAVYLGEGYFLTVKHLVYEDGDSPGLGQPALNVSVIYQGSKLRAKVVDYGKSFDYAYDVEWDDWAVLRIPHAIDLKPMEPDLAFKFEYGTPIARFGNDFQEGNLFATGNLGRKVENGLYSILAAAHPGISGGAVIDQSGKMVAIAVGKRIEGDNRAYIHPLLKSMFRKIPHLKGQLAQ